jgi:NIMA (never in mitosis gene a)-related kinase
MGRPLSEDKIWKFFIEMCLGLNYLHMHKILHRDVKTINMFLDKNNGIKIGDLGVAKMLNQTANMAHTVVGTPYYLSPELCEEKPYNHKSDVWSLGCVLYELCTYRHPFEATNQGALILKIVRGKFESIPGTYSQELKSITEMLLLKDTKRRPGLTDLLKSQVMKDKMVHYKYEMLDPTVTTPSQESKPTQAESGSARSSLLSSKSKADDVVHKIIASNRSD